MPRFFILATVLLATFVPHRAGAQRPDTPRLDATIAVTVVNLDVIVTDRHGKRVRGLAAEDFEVVEDGTARVITNFSEVDFLARQTPAHEAEPAQTPPAQPAVSRKIVVFVDNVSLRVFNRRRVFSALREFLQANVAPDDEVMIVSWNRRLRIDVPPTSDLVRIEAGLDALQKEIPAGTLAAARHEQALAEISAIADPTMPGADRAQMTRARAHAQEALNDTRQTAQAVNAILTRLGGVAGRKVLLLVTEGLHMRPGREVFERLDASGGLLEAESYNAAAIIESIAQAANASGVTIYAVHGAGPVSGVSAEDRDTDPEPDVLSGRSENFTSDQVSNSYTSLAYLALQTGGTAAVRRGMTSAFANIAEDLSAYYSIGYRSESSGKDGARAVRVRVKNPELTARTRKSYVEKSRGTGIRDQVVSTLFFSPPHSQIDVVARAGDVRRGTRGEVLVPVQVIVPAAGLTFVRDGDKYTALFSIMLAAADHKQSVSAVIERQYTVSFPAEEAEQAQADSFVHTIEIQTTAGNRVAVAVVDVGSTASGFATVLVPKKMKRRG